MKREVKNSGSIQGKRKIKHNTTDIIKQQFLENEKRKNPKYQKSDLKK
jgi:hypothetical protein